MAILQGFAKHRGRGGVLGRGEGLRQGKCVAPMRLPTIYRGGGGWFLALQVIGALEKVGGRNPIISLPHRLLSPFFRDLDLIPSGYDLIPSKVGSWCALAYMGQGHQPLEAHAPKGQEEGRVLKGEGTSEVPWGGWTPSPPWPPPSLEEGARLHPSPLPWPYI